ncbi:uncharacterized protein LOC131314023 [Rhododendron vialii]|uniref:uncharacterized protein LOC131314023 n=1 Tax=Rhododendron vialii TaxID=182163 RepID=UPI00265FF2BE|nr:uncharacterized protein LOC131314023 [Rhododendron vialii]
MHVEILLNGSGQYEHGKGTARARHRHNTFSIGTARTCASLVGMYSNYSELAFGSINAQTHKSKRFEVGLDKTFQDYRRGGPGHALTLYSLNRQIILIHRKPSLGDNLLNEQEKRKIIFPEIASLFAEWLNVFGCIEITSDKKNYNFYESDGAVDLLSYAWKLRTEGPYARNKVTRCIQIAFLCIQDDSGSRPSMTAIVLMLNSDSATFVPPQ